MRWESVPAGFERNASRLKRLASAAAELLVPCGWSMNADGLVYELDTPDEVEDRPGWAEVEAALLAAQAEMRQGEYADAMTDVGRALQLALTAAGHAGRTTAAQLKAAKKAGLFSKSHSNLEAAAECLLDWISAQRNTRSDSHPSDDPASRDDIVVALSAARAVIRYLQSASGSASSN